MPIDVAKLEHLTGQMAAFAPGGPILPRNALVASAWWMLRETEVANLRATCVNVKAGINPTATIFLPATKSDQEGQGVQRTHVCICGTGPPRHTCPAHAIWDQMLVLKETFPQSFVGGEPRGALPFSPRLVATSSPRSASPRPSS